MKQKRKVNSFGIVLIVITFIFACVFVLNFIFLKFENKFSNNLFTVISGWVSGISTLIVGLFAAMQSKNYNDSNQKYIDDSLLLRKCNVIVENRQKYVELFNSIYTKFKMEYKISYFSNEHDPILVKDIDQLKKLIVYRLKRQIADFTHWEIVFITCFRLDFDKNSEKKIASECLKIYQSELKKIVDYVEKNDINESFVCEIHNSSLKVYHNLLIALDNYFASINDDLNDTIFNKYNDYESLKKYSKFPEKDR